MKLIYRSFRNFSLDHSNLSQAITTQAQRNYQISAKAPINGYITKDQGAKHTVIMIHQWWGFNKSITKTADLFANKNIRVFVPDLYRGQPAKNAQDAGHKMNHLDWGKALSDVNLIKQHFASKSQEVSVMGFCMGGALTYAALASIPGFRAGGIFYGLPDMNTFKPQKITAKVIANFGSEDPLKGFSDPETAKALAEKTKNNPNFTVKIWPGVSHAFCNQDSKYFSQKTRDQAFKQTRKIFQS